MDEQTDIDREAAEHEGLCASLPDGHHLRQWALTVTTWIQRWREERSFKDEYLEQVKELTAERDALAEVERKGVLSVSRADLEQLIADRERLRADLTAERAKSALDGTNG